MDSTLTRVAEDSRAHWHRPDANDDTTQLHELLTVDDVARLLKVSKSWVYEHTRRRGMPRSTRLPHVKIGKYVRFEARAVREFVARLARTT